MIAPVEALRGFPTDLRAEEAAPIKCAGITTFNAAGHSGRSRRFGRDPGDSVCGIGTQIQFAAKFGFDVVAIGRGEDKQRSRSSWALGDISIPGAQNVAAELSERRWRGGDSRDRARRQGDGSAGDGLGGRIGRLVVVGASPEPLAVSSLQLIMALRSMSDGRQGPSQGLEDTIKFAASMVVRAMIETFPLEQAAQAYERMMTGKVRFRAVLTN